MQPPIHAKKKQVNPMVEAEAVDSTSGAPGEVVRAEPLTGIMMVKSRSVLATTAMLLGVGVLGATVGGVCGAGYCSKDDPDTPIESRSVMSMAPSTPLALSKFPTRMPSLSMAPSVSSTPTTVSRKITLDFLRSISFVNLSYPEILKAEDSPIIPRALPEASETNRESMSVLETRVLPTRWTIPREWTAQRPQIYVCYRAFAGRLEAVPVHWGRLRKLPFTKQPLSYRTRTMFGHWNGRYGAWVGHGFFQLL